MGDLFKRGGVWHYDFQFRKRRYQGSTFLRNHEKAKQYVSTIRTNLALALVGIAPPKSVPRFDDFLNKTFLEHVRQEVKGKRTIAFYEEKVKRLLEYPPFKEAKLDAVDELLIQGFKDWRPKQKKRAAGEGLVSITTVNGEIRTLRRALIYANDVNLLLKYPRVRTLAGETGRMYILTGEVENQYLAAAPSPLKEAAILILDLGIRPDECVRLKKADVVDEGVTVWFGKSLAARRFILQTERTRKAFEFLFAFWPDSVYVFPGHRKGSHLTRGALDHMHAKIRDAEDSGFVPQFLLYSCRHTFGTRLAESSHGDIFAIKEIMGHSSVKVSEKYVHPTERHTGAAMKQKELYDRVLRGETSPVEVPTNVVERVKSKP